MQLFHYVIQMIENGLFQV